MDIYPKNKYKVALVWPNGYNPEYSIPISLSYLKSNIDEKKYEVRIFDNALRNLSCDSKIFYNELKTFDPNVVGISTWSPMFLETLEIAKLVKSINSKVITVLGGAHITSYYERIMGVDDVDFMFRGEADLSFGVFLDELQKKKKNWNKIKGLVYKTKDGFKCNDMDRENNLDLINIPDYSAIKLEEYVKIGYRWNSPPDPNAPLWVTRGCPYRCQYCAAPDLNGRPVRKHSIEYMMRWITQLYYERGTRWFNIIDDNFTFDVKYAKAFCKAVIKLNLKGAGFGTPNGIRMQRGDFELWQLMKKAGWRHLIVAPESGSTHTLELMKKDLKLEVVPKVVKEIRKAGLKCQAFFIIGYPGERLKDLEETVKLIRKCKFNFVFLANFHPLPGTPVYDDLVKKGEIKDGLLPNNFADGHRAYTSKEFQNFNFSKFILKMHLLMMINDPLNIPYHFGLMFNLFSPKLVVKKFVLNIISMFFPKKFSATANYFQPMHVQSQSLNVSVIEN